MRVTVWKTVFAFAGVVATGLSLATGDDNLFRNSRFPLGLPASWTIVSADPGEPPEIIGDNKTFGPSGAPAMKITSGPITLLSERFAPVVNKTYSVALFVKGTGLWEFQAAWDGDWEHGDSANAGAGDPNKWQRIVLQLPEPGDARFGYLRIAGAGELWVDGLQADRPAAINRGIPNPGRSEVALAMWPRSAGAVNVLFDDEEPFLHACVSGPNTHSIWFRMTGVTGETAGPGEAKLRGNRRYTSVACALSDSRIYGPLLFESWFGPAADWRQSPINSRVIHRWRRPLYWGRAAENKIFGTRLPPHPQAAVLAKAAGINWVVWEGESEPTEAVRERLAKAGLVLQSAAFAEEAAVLETPAIVPETWLFAGLGETVAERPGISAPEEDRVATSVKAAEAHAEAFCRAAVDLLAAGKKRILVPFGPAITGVFPDPSQPVTAGLAGPDGMPTPMAAAFSSLAWLVEDTDFSKTIEATPDLTAHLFNASHKRAAILVSGSGTSAGTLPKLEKTLAFDVLGNPLESGATLDGGLVFLWSFLDGEELEAALQAGFGAANPQAP